MRNTLFHNLLEKAKGNVTHQLKHTFQNMCFNVKLKNENSIDTPTYLSNI